jgi:hypothetical protein
MASGNSRTGKSTVLDILVHGADAKPDTTMSVPFLADSGRDGVTRSILLHGPIPLASFCNRWKIAGDRPNIDLFFIGTEGTDNSDSDRVAMNVLPVLGSIADIRLCVMRARSSVGARTEFLNGLKAASFLSSVRSLAVAIVIRECDPPKSKFGNASPREKRLLQDRAENRDFREAAAKAEMQYLYEPDDSRFLCLCQPCWKTYEDEHRASMTELAQFIVQNASVTPAVSVDWVITTVDTVAAEIQKRTNGKGIVNESAIWSSLLGKACDDAENEVTEAYRKLAMGENFQIATQCSGLTLSSSGMYCSRKHTEGSWPPVQGSGLIFCI